MNQKAFNYLKLFFVLILFVGILGLFIPQDFIIPVQGANNKSYNKNSFWYYPWGKSVTHKGVDIFAKKGTPVLASTNGFVLFTGINKMGGNIILIIGPKWRFHYYAHLQSIDVKNFSIISQGKKIATVGDTENAKGKPSHLHYSIMTPIPYINNFSFGPHGLLKIFYLNPINYF